MTEFHPYNNTTFYGASKIAGEHMLKSLYHRYKNTEKAFDYCGLRYFNVYGPRQDYMGAYVAVIMKILDRLDKNLSPVVYGDGSQAYDFIAVQDCAKANICAMKSDATDNFYNVCTGTKTSIKELAEMILEITGKQFPIEYNTQGVSFVKNRIGSTVKIQKDLSFFPDINLKEGLMKLIEWRSKHKYELEMRKSKAGAAE
ncbi:MAG: dTDP-glucose 4,6-dehydratase [Bacteroidetes bacterium ADurb.Bin234]|nr:MAG: dTDP-glucose 4,6-dehydratase [Bacteroidetes bacterium ADurb.Bin234]